MPVKFSKRHGGCDAYDLDYIGDKISEYRCCATLLKLPPDLRSDLLTSISDPTKRRRVVYFKGMFLLTLSHLVSSMALNDYSQLHNAFI
jgi:hypothetical protein